jgi:hypothetical protein
MSARAVASTSSRRLFTLPALSRSVAICPICGHEQPFLRQLLFVITGANGMGKTAVCRTLAPLDTTTNPLDETVAKSEQRIGERRQDGAMRI